VTWSSPTILARRPAGLAEGSPGDARLTLLHDFFTGLHGPPASPRHLRLTALIRLGVGLPGLLLPTFVHHWNVAQAHPESTLLHAMMAVYAGLVILYAAANIVALAFHPRFEAMRALGYLAIAIELLTNQITQYLIGSGNAALMFFPLVCAYRIGLDYSSALLAALGAVALNTGTTLAEVLGLVPIAPALPVPPDVYQQPLGVLRQLLVHLFGFVISFAAVNYGMNQTLKLHRYITESVLRRYLPPSLVRRAAEGELRLDEPPERRTVTVMFIDLVGFTTLSEHLGADRVAQLLNRFLTRVTELAYEHGATIDKFVGDAVMIVYGAPDPMSAEEQARACVRLGMEVTSTMAAFDDPPLSLRVGINTGEAVVGHFGSPIRSDFTVIGPAVNIAARLEGASTPGRVLVGESTANLLGDGWVVEPAGEISLRGVAQPVRAFFVGASH
jgi:class 3 adenylate cyclase